MGNRRLFVIAGFGALLFATLVFGAPEATIRALRILRVPVPKPLKRLETDRLIARLKKSAAEGDCGAQYALAQELHLRQFPVNSFSISMQGEARKWLIQSAENGCVDAMTEIGRYADDAGDHREALTWYRKAADLGDPYAEWMMGGYYEDGEGLKRDLGIALQWYKRAQNSGFHAESYIANVYATENDLLQAHSWYQRALEAGDGFAAERLGQCYKYGDKCAGRCESREQCPKDLYLAYFWLRVAALYGNCLGCYRDMIPLLSPPQISQGDREALAWTRAHPRATEK